MTPLRTTRMKRCMKWICEDWAAMRKWTVCITATLRATATERITLRNAAAMRFAHNQFQQKHLWAIIWGRLLSNPSLTSWWPLSKSCPLYQLISSSLSLGSCDQTTLSFNIFLSLSSYVSQFLSYSYWVQTQQQILACKQVVHECLEFKH